MDSQVAKLAPLPMPRPVRPTGSPTEPPNRGGLDAETPGIWPCYSRLGAGVRKSMPGPRQCQAAAGTRVLWGAKPAMRVGPELHCTAPTERFHWSKDSADAKRGELGQ